MLIHEELFFFVFLFFFLYCFSFLFINTPFCSSIWHKWGEVWVKLPMLLLCLLSSLSMWHLRRKVQHSFETQTIQKTIKMERFKVFEVEVEGFWGWTEVQLRSNRDKIKKFNSIIYMVIIYSLWHKDTTSPLALMVKVSNKFFWNRLNLQFPVEPCLVRLWNQWQLWHYIFIFFLFIYTYI